MAEEREDVFQARLDKALNFLSERGFSRELRQEQGCSVKQLFSRGDLLAVLPTGFGKCLIFQVLALMKEDCVILVICPLKLILRTTLIGGRLREGYLCLKTARDYRYFPSLIFEDSPAQILKFFAETSHCLFLSLEKTPELICVSDFFPLACLANAYLLELTY